MAQLRTNQTNTIGSRIGSRIASGYEIGGNRHASAGHDRARDSRRSPVARALLLWYRLTAPAEPAPSAPFPVRERARRGRLLSVMLLGFLLILAGGFYQYRVVDDDHPLMLDILMVALALAVVVAALNRLGRVPLAGALMVLLAELPLAGPFAATKDGRLDILPLGAF